MFDIPPVPPPVVVVGRDAPDRSFIVEMQPGVVRCGGELVRPERLERVFPTEQQTFDGSPPRLRPVALDFEIDRSGRPMSIKRARDGALPGYLPGGAPDLEPALARSAFPKAAKVNCSLSFTPEVTPLDAATDDQLVRLTLFRPQPGAPAKRIAERLAPKGSTCLNDGPQPRVLVYPELEPIARRLESVEYTSLLYDIDAEGRPGNLRPLAGSGHAGLDAEVRRAVSESRFRPEAKTGCLVPFFVQPREELKAPPPIPLSALRPAGVAACKGVLREIPEISFPQPFQRRGIEGWAVVRYSVAPWGELGEFEVVAAQPASAFGDSALSLIRRAKANKGEPRSGCLQRVAFELPDDGQEPGVQVRSGGEDE